MKRWIPFLLAIILILGGCSAQSADSSPSKNDNENPEISDNGQLWVYQDTAVYTLKKDDVSFVFSLEFGDDTPACLGKGELLGLYGSHLLAKNDTHYILLDLDGSRKWVTLSPKQTETTQLLWNDELFLFSHHQEKNFLDIISLPAMTCERKEISSRVLDAVILNNHLYTLSQKDGVTLCTWQRSGLTEEPLYEIDADHLYGAGNRIAFSKEGYTFPKAVYDLTEKSIVSPIDGGLLVEIDSGIAVLRRQGTLVYYDIASGLEIDEQSYTDRVKKDVRGHLTNAEKDTVKLHLDDTVYRIDLGEQIVTANWNDRAVSAQGCALLSPQMKQICMVKWSPEKETQTGICVKYCEHPFF